MQVSSCSLNGAVRPASTTDKGQQFGIIIAEVGGERASLRLFPSSDGQKLGSEAAIDSEAPAASEPLRRDAQ